MDELENKIKQLIKDDCETDTYIRKSALRVLTESTVMGDSYAVPPLEDIIDLLVERILDRDSS